MNVWAQSFLSITNHPHLFVRGCCTIGRGENEWNGKDTWVLVWVFPEVSGPTHGNATLNIPWRRYPILLFLNSSDTVTYLINVCTYPFTLCHHIVQSERIFRPNISQLQVRDGGLPCLFNQLTVVQWIFKKSRAFLKKGWRDWTRADLHVPRVDCKRCVFCADQLVSHINDGIALFFSLSIEVVRLSNS